MNQNKQSPPEWIEVLVPAPVRLVDGLAAELVSSVKAAQDGVQVRKGEIVLWVARAALEETIADLHSCLRALADQGWEVDPDRVRAGNLAPEEEWRDAWKKHFHVTRLTRQIVVVPSWEEHEPLATDIAIHLDPGQAFGTGAHASTQLVLEMMQALVDGDMPAPARVFDLGTGSGILAIAAARWWPQCHVVATDIDPLSIDATLENAEKNAVQAQIDVSTQDLSAIEESFPLVLANIQAHTLRSLRDALIPRVQSGGRLLLSGILSSQIHSLCEYYDEVEGLRLESIRQSELNEEWSSALMSKA